MVGAGEQIAVSQPEGGSAAESTLIQAALAGDRAALEQLLGPHRRSVVAVCYGILGNTEDAEDAAQETFVRALRGLSGFRGEAAFHSWLIRIALNLCFSWKRSRHPTETWEEDTSRSSAASPEVVALSHLRLMAALDSLSPHRRAALLLAVNDQPATDADQLRQRLRLLAPGQAAKLRLARGGEALELTATLGGGE
jgi:RNA polymerase sigma factor (sigma-70 family)